MAALTFREEAAHVGFAGTNPCALKAGQPPHLYCLGTVLALLAALTLSNRSLEC